MPLNKLNDHFHYEILTYDSLDSIPTVSWYNSLLILYQITGSSDLIYKEKEYSMQKTDILIINPYELFSLRPQKDSSILLLFFASSLLEKIDAPDFDCFTINASSNQNQAFVKLQNQIAALLGDLTTLRLNTAYSLSCTYAIFDTLITFFSRSTEKIIAQGNTRMSQILRYLNTNFREEITLNDLSKKFYLQPNYISQLFTKELGRNFTRCLRDIRLNHAFFELYNTENSITDIASNNGFPRIDSFINSFREIYGKTPYQYRKLLRKAKPIEKKQTFNNKEQISHEKQSLLEIAIKNLSTIGTEQKKVIVQVDSDGTKLAHDWKKIINAGYAQDCLNFELQQQLQEIQNQIGFEYIRFHGIFSDNLHIYHEDHNGNPYLAFTYVNMLLDRLQNMGFKLFIELGFLPKKLAGNQKPVYQNNSYIGYPSSIRKWLFLVRSFLLHCINRYGSQTIRQWKFSLFSMINVQYQFINKNDFFTLYKETYRTIKEIDPEISFGGPGIHGQFTNEEESKNLYRSFINYSKKHLCIPDFFTMHSYPHSNEDIINKFHSVIHNENKNTSIKLSEDSSYLKNMITAGKELLVEEELAHIPLIIDEWDSTVWQWDGINDTSYKACFLCKNILETSGKTAGKGYWTLSDLVSDQEPDMLLFHGGHGLFTVNGVKKPGYYAYQFIAKLGNRVISSGDGWFITKTKQSLQILLYNYAHYNILYKTPAAPIDNDYRFDVFKNASSTEFSFIAIGGAEHYNCEYFKLSSESGSALHEWLKLGAPKDLSVADLEYIKNLSVPARRIEQNIEINNLKIELKPLDVVLIILDPADSQESLY